MIAEILLFVTILALIAAFIYFIKNERKRWGEYADKLVRAALSKHATEYNPEETETLESLHRSDADEFKIWREREEKRLRESVDA